VVEELVAHHLAREAAGNEGERRLGLEAPQAARGPLGVHEAQRRFARVCHRHLTRQRVRRLAAIAGDLRSRLDGGGPDVGLPAGGREERGEHEQPDGNLDMATHPCTTFSRRPVTQG
jgi:hypothetical protein